MLLAFLMAAFLGILSVIASDSHVGRVKLTDVLVSKKCNHYFESKGNTDGASVDLDGAVVHTKIYPRISRFMAEDTT